MKTAIDFSADMLKLSAITFSQLFEIKLEDLAALVTHQNTMAEKAAAVHDVAGFMTLQREYQAAFWNDRLNALDAAHTTLQTALEQAGLGIRELTKEAGPPERIMPAKVTAPTTAAKRTRKRKRAPP